MISHSDRFPLFDRPPAARFFSVLVRCLAETIRWTWLAGWTVVAIVPSLAVCHTFYLSAFNIRYTEAAAFGLMFGLFPILLPGCYVYSAYWNRLHEFRLPERCVIRLLGYVAFSWGMALTILLILMITVPSVVIAFCDCIAKFTT